MGHTLNIVVSITLLAGSLVLFIWFLIQRIKKSDDPVRILVKTIATFIIACICAVFIIKEVGFNVAGAFIVPFICVALGVIGSIVWAPHIGAVLAKPLTSAFDGGNMEIVPQPLYSIAIAKRKAGKFQESIMEIRKQLEQFPNDVNGQIMLAEIQAENLRDLQAADLTIQRFCHQPGHAPENIAIALNSMADWQLKYAQDTEAARRCLEQIVEMLPDTQLSQLALQRIAHLEQSQIIAEGQERPAIPMQIGAQNVGLMTDSAKLRPPDEDPLEVTTALINHLEQHPYDSEAREKLALRYAEHHQRIDLAIAQLEELIQNPNQPPKHVVRWLNLMADLQIKQGDDYEKVKATLERIIDLYPARASAESARQRLDHVKFQIKGHEKAPSIPLGTYEQNLGLKKK